MKMNHKKTFILGLGLGLVFLLVQCRKDEPTNSGSSFVGTPYDFTVPVGFPQANIPADNPMDKRFVNRKSHTSYRVSPEGRQAFQEHLNALESLLNQK